MPSHSHQLQFSFASSQTCDPKKVSDNPWVYMKESLIGCWTSFIREDQAEVHILNLDFTMINNNSTITLFSEHPSNIHKQDFPTQDEELVKWARQKFGGVTSFTTIRNLKTISSTGIKGTKPDSPYCILKNEDASEKHFMKIETIPLASFKYCSPQQQNRGDEAELHIINIPEKAITRNVSLHVDTEKSSLFLRGPQGTTWTFLALKHTQFGSNNDILLPAMTHRIDPTITTNSDNAEDVQRMALDYFKASTFTSYTELELGQSMVSLVLGKKDNPAVTETVPVIAITTNAPHQMPLLMQLYTSPDYRSPLDPNTKVQSDKRIYAEISGQTLGDIFLTIKVISCFVRSMGSCPVEKELPFMPETCSLNSCPNSTRLSFSLDQLQELTSTTWDLECSVKLCYSENCGDGGRVKRNLKVTQPCLQPPRERLRLGTQLHWTLAQLQQIFLDAPAQEQNDNLFLPSLPPLRIAAPTQALEAPKAHRPAAWHEIMVISTTCRATVSLQSHLYGFCAFTFFINT
ncbi:hypothetical protein FQN60_008310 [Etheostoma spectabile]|uniref:TGFBR3/Endoglin-like N-terminal domain-containing protein n=1 Tax=Etheostoma spectabile TaxID=54343 RepID=A0A5J5CW62_9PERO|nr:hypothetical protein FQN60_008310 [Etheostoma spectabile]